MVIQNQLKYNIWKRGCQGMNIKEDYYLGLDIGTNSIGWAVTDKNYNITKFNGKAMWGVRLFENGKTAEERRLHRASRRRTARKVARIKLLQELFSEEIYKVDPGFFMRLKESKFHIEDKKTRQPNCLFNDNKFDDKQYNKLYPTIYHLRKELINNDGKVDIRLIYLALHHIIKHRGHFLFEGDSIKNVNNFEPVFNKFITLFKGEFDIDINYSSIKEIESILKNKKMGINTKKKELEKQFDSEYKQVKMVAHILAGAKVKLSDLLVDGELEKSENNKIQFGSSNYEEIYSKLEDILSEKIIFIDLLKSIYDWGILQNILKGERYLSYAKVSIYEKHAKDLKLLKNIVKKHLQGSYMEIFGVKGKDNYSAYIGSAKSNNKKISIKICQKEEFYKFIKKVIDKIEKPNNSDIQYVLSEIDSGTFLPKQVSKDNSVIPNQVHKEELKVILEKAAKHYEFLNKIDSTKISTGEKIIKLFSFRIPYYVGPLNDYHKKENGKGFCWVTKKSKERITPWNFEKVVDIDKSSEDFINRMTNKCTYLIGEDVIPKKSILYSEYTVLNELNNVRINNERLPNNLKAKIFNQLFLKQKKITQKRLLNFLSSEGLEGELSGLDGDFKNSMASFIDFKNIIGNKANDIEMIEEIIKWIVLFGDAKKILRDRINAKYRKVLSEDEIKRIITLKYTGWGRFSKKFLSQIYHVDKSSGEMVSIIKIMRENSINLMELLSKKYDFLNAILKHNKNEETETNKISYKMVEDLYVSPAIKRSIWQTLLITEEIKKITKKEPKKIFIEMARGQEEKKRTKSRRDKLVELYKACKKEERDWVNELLNREESSYKSDRLYFYYTQMGKCMYTNEIINLDDLYNSNIYDIDHIYPQSKIKDDSLDNRVLVKKVINSKKTDIYPISSDIQKKNRDFWNYLFSKRFISKRKHERLTRVSPFTQDELASFIERQIVETRQSTKVVAQLLTDTYKESNIIYVKAGNISSFRNKRENNGEIIKELVKVREINDFHHADDAYLAIVVGNVYDTKFTWNPYNFIKSDDKYNMNRIFENDVVRNNYFAWKRGNKGTISIVKKNISKNNKQFTRRAYEQKGQLFNITPMKKGKGQLSLKSNDSRLKDINKYGGYNKIAGAYFTLVEHKQKENIIRTIEYVPIYLSEIIKNNHNKLIKYLTEELNLIECRVIIPRIKINTLFKIDGYYLHLSARTQSRLIFKNAIELMLQNEEKIYYKRLYKYNQKIKNSKKLIIPNEFDGITNIKNINLYNSLINKLSSTIYNKRLSTQADKFLQGKEIFEKLTINNQCEFLCEAIKLFSCNMVKANLSLIGGAKNAGTIVVTNKVINFEEIKIIYQSPTGLFEKEVNIKEI